MRFPGFKGEWEEKKLGDIGELLGGGTPASSNADYWNGNIPWISSSDLKENNVNEINISRYISDEAVNSSATKLCNAPTIHIVSRVGVGKVAYSTSSLCTSQDFVNIVNFECNGVFLSYLLSIEMLKAASHTQGTSIKGISSLEIKAKRVLLPQMQEQNKVSELLSKIDSRIYTQNKIIEQLETSIQVFRNQIFKQKIRFKNNIMPNFSEWDVKKLGELADKRNRKNKDLSIKVVFSNSAILGIINQTDFFDKEIANQNNINSYYIVEKNDFVYNPRISKEAPVGPLSRNKIGTGVMSPLYMILRFNEGSVDFFEHYFKSNVWHVHMESIANYGARADRMSFSNSDFFEMPVPIPVIEEQIEITNFLNRLEQKNEIEKQILKGYKNQKEYLLHNLFM